MIALLGAILLFFGVTLGLAWPFVARLTLDASEKLLVTVALSLLGVFLFSWLVYVFALPPATVWGLPVLAASGVFMAKRAFSATMRDSAGRDLVCSQVLVSAWCLGWLSLVASYSGGGWAGDWFEHWERARFFLERGARDFLFLGTYPLPARPPLANVVTAAFLQLGRPDFAHYQVISTLLASLVFLPAALLARRFGGDRRALAVLAVFFMLNPLFVQNAVFAWTKLPAAFFALTALYFFLRARDNTEPRGDLALCALALAAGSITHYSVGPYVVMLALGWLVFQSRAPRDAAWWRATAFAALVGALVLATWFGWSFLTYGARGTLFSNSSITSGDMHQGNQVAKIALNLLDTLVPHFFRSFDPALIAQRNAWGWWRDVFFQAYQLNLPLAFGSVAWLAIVRELARAARGVAAGTRSFWVVFAAGVTLLGVAAHGQRDHWGLTHICLQALVLLGLSFLAARWEALGRGWRLALVAGAALDFILGIAWHFAVQNFAPDRWLAKAGGVPETIIGYNEVALMNLSAKLQHHVNFLSDTLAWPAVAPVLLLGILLLAGLRRASSSVPT